MIRFIIAYGFLWKEVVGEISGSSVDLKFKKIAGDLYTENWDKIFELKRDEKEYRVVLLVKKNTGRNMVGKEDSLLVSK